MVAVVAVVMARTTTKRLQVTLARLVVAIPMHTAVDLLVVPVASMATHKAAQVAQVAQVA